MDSVLAKWTELRKNYIEAMPIEEREKYFPETLQDGYSWEAGAIRDYLLVHISKFKKMIESGELKSG